MEIAARELPNSRSAEMGVLGSMLISPREIIAECVEKINENYFYVPAHQTIYLTLVDLWNKGQAIDLLTFTQVLRDRKLLEAVGGAGNVTALFTFVPTSANITYYLEIVRDKYILRQIIVACTEAVRRAFEEQDEVYSLLDEVEEKVLSVGKDRFTGEKSIKEFVAEAVEHIERLYAGKGEIIGLKTGISDLDKKLRGLKPGELIVVAGQTGEGKTAIALNIVEHNSIKLHEGSAVLSLEMTGDELTHRLIQSVARISIESESQKASRDQSIARLAKASELVLMAPIHIRDDSDMTAMQARAVIRKLCHDNKITLVVADYAQLFLPDKKRDDTKATELSEIAKSFKRMAKELGVVVILLSQLNDQGQLYDSRAIGHHADKVIQIRRDGDKTFLDIKKNRNGERGTVPVIFLRNITRFENAARDLEIIRPDRNST